jgi:hypothetical protein
VIQRVLSSSDDESELAKVVRDTTDPWEGVGDVGDTRGTEPDWWFDRTGVRGRVEVRGVGNIVEVSERRRRGWENDPTVSAIIGKDAGED